MKAVAAGFSKERVCEGLFAALLPVVSVMIPMAGICSGPAYILASSSGVTPNMKLGTSLAAATISSSRGV